MVNVKMKDKKLKAISLKIGVTDGVSKLLYDHVQHVYKINLENKTIDETVTLAIKAFEDTTVVL